jgi:putative transposase
VACVKVVIAPPGFGSLLERLDLSQFSSGYLHAFSGGGEARGGIGGWIDFYNNCRPHSAHGGATPAGVY